MNNLKFIITLVCAILLWRTVDAAITGVGVTNGLETGENIIISPDNDGFADRAGIIFTPYGLISGDTVRVRVTIDTNGTPGYQPVTDWGEVNWGTDTHDWTLEMSARSGFAVEVDWEGRDNRWKVQPHGTYNIRIEVDEDRDLDWTDAEPDESLTVTLLTAGIRGKITSGDKPVSGAMVSAGNSSIQSDENGNYAIYGLLGGFYPVEVQKSGYAYQSRDNVQVNTECITPDVDFDLVNEADANIALTGAVTGTVTGFSDYTKVVVTAFEPDRAWEEPLIAMVDTAGTFRITGAGTGFYIINANQYSIPQDRPSYPLEEGSNPQDRPYPFRIREGSNPEDRPSYSLKEGSNPDVSDEWQLTADGNFGLAAEPVSVVNGEETSGVVLQLKPGGIIRGNVTVDSIPQDRPYPFRIREGSNPQDRPSYPLKEGSNPEDRPSYPLEEGSNRGLTVSETAGRMVQAFPMEYQLIGTGEKFFFSGAIDSAGNYEIKGLSAGVYAMEAECKSSLSCDTLTVILAEGEIKEGVNITLRAAYDMSKILTAATLSVGVLSGTISKEGADPDNTVRFALPLFAQEKFKGLKIQGLPLAYILLQRQDEVSSDPMDGIEAVSEPGEGNTTVFKISNILPGIYTLKAFCSGFDTAIVKDIVIEPGENIIDKDGDRVQEPVCLTRDEGISGTLPDYTPSLADFVNDLLNPDDVVLNQQNLPVPAEPAALSETIAAPVSESADTDASIERTEKETKEEDTGGEPIDEGWFKKTIRAVIEFLKNLFKR